MKAQSTASQSPARTRQPGIFYLVSAVVFLCSPFLMAMSGFAPAHPYRLVAEMVWQQNRREQLASSFTDFQSRPAVSSLQDNPTGAIPEPDVFPTLDAFAASVRQEGSLGLWADGLFAYRVYFMNWGMVPDKKNTASYSQLGDFHAFFIHSHLGGDLLYRVPKWTKVALIWADRIEWYLVDATVRYQGTPNGQPCGYQAPYGEWGQSQPLALTADEIIRTHYSKDFAIQTCVCQDGKAGVQILSGVRTTP